MTTLSAEEARETVRLRTPALIFAILGLFILFAIGLALAAWAGGGGIGIDPGAALALALPVAAATGLAGVMLARRFRRGPVHSRIALIWRAVSAFGAMGLAWPLSFSASALSQGDANTALVQAVSAPIVALAGALAGALASVVAAFLCTHKSIAPGATDV